MNIFVTHPEPNACAKVLDDKRVVKMVLETAQMLSTALHVHGYDGEDQIYKPTHINHPCTKWTRATRSNYLWLRNHFGALCMEHTNRYSKIHASNRLVRAFLLGEKHIPDGDLTPFPQCTPNYEDIPNIYQAYQLYLVNKWTNDKRKPTWYGTDTPIPFFPTTNYK